MRDFENSEIIPRRKKKSQKSKIKARSDHKHEYETVILRSIIGWYWGRRCKICGRIDDSIARRCVSGSHRADFMKPEYVDKHYYSHRCYLSTDELRIKYPGVPIYVFAEPHTFGNYVELKENNE